mgnify:CR=1 FL=1
MTLQETRAYDDIINLPHHQSRKHPHMSRHQRAAIAQAEAQGDTDFGA